MEYSVYRKIPNLLRKYRKSRGLNQRQVAAILGLKSASRISRWERGNCLPCLMNAIRLSILCRTMIDGLFGDLARALRNELIGREEKVLSNSNASKDGSRE